MTKEDGLHEVVLKFQKKAELENHITQVILAFENETGLMIDKIRFSRDATLPIHSPLFTELLIKIVD